MGGAIPPPVVPAATATAPAAAPAPVPVGEATVVALPDRLQDIARPVVLTGTVLGETPEGLTRIRTSAGEVRIDSPTPLPADKPVTLQITPGQTAPNGALQAKPTALILLQSLATASGGAATGTQAPAAPTPGNTGVPTVILQPPTPPATPALPTLLPGTVVPALVLASATATKPLQPPAGALPPVQPAVPGTLVAAPPAGSPAPAGDAATPPLPAPVTAPPQSGSAPAASPLPTAPMLDLPVELGGDAAHPGAETPTLKPANPEANPEAPDLPRGATVALRILTVTPPPQQPKPPGQPDNGSGPRPQQGQSGTGGQPQPSPPADPAATPMTDPMADLAPDAPILRGTVAGTTPQGQPVLATRQGMLALNVQASLPQGAKVTAVLADPAQAARQAAQAAPLPGGDPGPMSERDWPAMRQLMAALAAADPALARSMLATMPQPNRKLTAALTFFLSAMRGGDARGWLGDEAGSALERSGRGDLLARLDKEFEGLRREASEPMPGDWRPYTLPMMDSNGPKPIKLHIHPLKGDEEEGGDGKEKGKPGSRFLIDVEMSRLGPMQLDGLVRPNHFDLILRSHAALPPELRVELIQIFADSVRAVGYTGGLSFQSGAKSWVKLTRAGKSALGVSA
ncbi:hypothetical protein [Azospirillum agricola]|uniref:hypothetical protein n=1 Tax=Azospirillum agricola TaxID=1720247 RepID=UPI000A0EF147|nr:hypothetical protein [Azospirillum agricola]SMH47529.1 hypothetical protein SAMN02982994_2616 [Azospirillum lipoferum]